MEISIKINVTAATELRETYWSEARVDREAGSCKEVSGTLRPAEPRDLLTTDPKGPVRVERHGRAAGRIQESRRGKRGDCNKGVSSVSLCG